MKRVMWKGEMYAALPQNFKQGGDAVVRANIADRSGLFEKTAVIPFNGAYFVAVRGKRRDPYKVTPEGLRADMNLPKRIRYNRKTGEMI
jgi:hypothetical protein